LLGTFGVLGITSSRRIVGTETVGVIYVVGRIENLNSIGCSHTKFCNWMKVSHSVYDATYLEGLVGQGF